jgi:membrane associated rhomboid family serine protease
VQDPDASPLNPLPPPVAALALIIAGIELTLAAAARGMIGGAEGVGWRQAALERYAFFGEIFDWMAENGAWPVEQVARFITYPFVNFAFTQTLFVVVFLLALGKMVAEAMGTAAFLVIFFGSAVVGALAYGVLLDDPRPLAGGFPAVYGLIGGYTWILWTSLGRVGAPQGRAFTLIGMLLGIQLVFGVIFGSSNEWVAEAVGFVTGFVLSSVMGPGGWRRALETFRRR